MFDFHHLTNIACVYMLGRSR